MKIITASDRRSLDRLLAADRAADRAFERRVRAIVDEVREGGGPALARFARRFDAAKPPLEITPAEIRRQAATVPANVRRALARAARNIAKVARPQVPKGRRIRVVPGVVIEQRIEPLARVGCYVPGGRFPLPSSLLMTAIPAREAGVAEIVAACPRPEPVIMAAALEAGVTRLFRMGGAHAIAALAYGAGPVPKVDKIVGPGNRWVAAAKAYVSKDCAIDFFAGPTEIAILAGTGSADWIAADLVAQAEHDPDARSVLVTWSRRLAARVSDAVTRAAKGRGIVEQSLARHGAIVIVKNEKDAVALVNRVAPEHLVVDRESLARERLVAGAVFVGPFTAQAAGDYATGSNHVLPTAGAARFRGGLSAADFVRVMSIQRVSRRGLAILAPTITTLARAEGLTAHAESIEIRLGTAPEPKAESREP
jgi:histidinol dehydrogenase